MDEALLTFGFAILAVGVAAFLRRCRNRREASEDIITLVKKIAALEQRTRDFERRLSELRLGCSVVPTAKMESDRPQPVPLAATPNEPAFARMLGRENGLARVERRLYALKSILPEDIYLGEKYVAETSAVGSSKGASLADDGDSDVQTLTLFLKMHPLSGILLNSAATGIRW